MLSERTKKVLILPDVLGDDFGLSEINLDSISVLYRTLTLNIRETEFNVGIVPYRIA